MNFLADVCKANRNQYNLILGSMMDRKLHILWLLSLLPGIVLQPIGIFSSHWVRYNATSECFRGVFHSSDNCPENVQGKKKDIYILL